MFLEGDFARSGERPEFRDVYAVFARSPKDRDARAVSHAAHWFNEPYDPRHDKLGRVVASEARVLLDELGGEQDILYAVPTDKGFMCIGLAPNGGSHCGGSGPGGFDLAYSYDPKDSLLVYGMIGNDVVGVEVLVSGRTHVARMGENGFAIRIKSGKPSELGSVVLHYRDKPSETIELP